MQISHLSTAEIFQKYDVNGDGLLNPQEVRHAIISEFGIRLNPSQLFLFFENGNFIDLKRFSRNFEVIFPHLE
jgi:hypothetical protein